MSFRDALQEVRDLGPGAAIFRAVWELKMRMHLMERLASAPVIRTDEINDTWYERTPFTSPLEVRRWFAASSPDSIAELRQRALASLNGEIVCFGRWVARFGNPIEWNRDPVTDERWPAGVHWSRAIQAPTASDIKFVWEVARFPHAFLLARAAVADVEIADRCARGLTEQIEEFRSANPYGTGVHWASGLEIALRAMSWTFAAAAFGSLGLWDRATLRSVGAGLLESATYIEEYFSFAEKSVANDHLIGEATALLMIAAMFPDFAPAERWRRKAECVLTREAGAQIYADGAYMMHSHNYHRSVVQYFVLASEFVRHGGQQVPAAWTNAIGRSVRFLVAHMNPVDGRLPNSGSNDGGMPLWLTACDYADFRPVLQSGNVVAEGRRLFAHGAWDEEALWLSGGAAIESTIDPPQLRSIVFADSGYCVLRSRDPSTFIAMRCGSIRNRFPQIDMLHVDVWWNGINVLVDGGSYMYNGPREWHDYFYRTASHNSVVIDGTDQMRHYRQFKVLYWTQARIREFNARGPVQFVVAEHYGYRRLPGSCVHTRSVLLAGDDLCVVYDVVTGEGTHDLRLHWQAADFPAAFDSAACTMTLDVGGHPFGVTVRDVGTAGLSATVVAGRTNPIRGWYSRYYGEKIAAPSLAVEAKAALPAAFLTVMGPGKQTLTANGDRWRIEGLRSVVEFTVDAGQSGVRDIVTHAK